MTVEEFNYDLPEELIAQTPIKKRDESRLMVLDKKTGDVVDRFVSVKAAARFYNLRQSNISYVCAGKLKTTGGYKFKFVS